MRVLLVGSGNREHALAWKLSQSPLCSQLYSYPSSDLLRLHSQPVSLEGGHSWEQLAEFVLKEKVDLAVCGPEAPLAEGLEDLLKEKAPLCKVIGPSKAAARLESSKEFAKTMMKKAGVPTAQYQMASSYEQALSFSCQAIQDKGGVVLKADGLASGKGVFVCHSKEEVEKAVAGLKKIFSSSEPRILIEEELVGREFSYFSLVNERFHTPLGCAVDFKRLEEGDCGPNTGGMGAYTPVPWLPSNWEKAIKEKIVDPLLSVLLEEGVPYKGVLYCGLMLTPSGFKVIEFNVRLGDPEAQALLVNDKRDYLQLFLDSLDQKDGYGPYSPTSTKTIAAVVASSDYPYCEKEPQQFENGLAADFFENQQSPYCFGSSLVEKDSFFYPQKGRVMTVVASSETSFAEVREQLLARTREVQKKWPKSRLRGDIALKVSREESFLEKRA